MHDLKKLAFYEWLLFIRMHNEYKINFWKAIFVNILSISRQMTPLDSFVKEIGRIWNNSIFVWKAKYSNELNICHYVIPI